MASPRGQVVAAGALVRIVLHVFPMLHRQPADTLIGRMLGEKYELLELVASGGMGRIYLARCLVTDVPVVVKVLQRELFASQHASELFRSEAFLLSRIVHPNVVSIIDFGQSEDGLLYLVMEHVSGRTVRDLVCDEGPQPTAMVVSLAQQLLAGLAAVHAAGIVHGDVTSDNLMVHRTEDGVVRVKLIDFGLARLIGGADAGVVRAADQVCGTPGYMAPEVFRGGLPSVTSDLYSAAVVIYELLTGEMPFDAPTLGTLYHLQATGTPVPPSRYREGSTLAGGIDESIARALIEDPARRCTAEELLAALLAQRDAEVSGVCGSCGRPVGAGLLRCLTCGVTAHARAASVTHEGALSRFRARAVTAPLARTGLAISALARAPADRLRDGIGRALQLGDIDHTIELYLGLATVLENAGDPRAALDELTEAVDIVTLGRGAEAARGPLELWRLLLLLGQVQARAGRSAAARATAAHAHRHASRVGATRGMRNAQWLLRVLGREPGEPRPRGMQRASPDRR